MWHILKAELSYHKKIFLSISSFIPVISFQAVYPVLEDLSANYMMLLLMFLMLQNWIIFRNKEGRTRQYVSLPLSTWKIAVGRFFVITIICTGTWIFYSFVVFILNSRIQLNHSRLLLILGIIFLGFSLYFVLRDLLFDTFKRIGLNRERLIVGGLLIMLGLNLLGVFFFMTPKSMGTPPGKIISFIRYLKYDNPFFECIVVGIILACLSVWTYNQRNSYLA